MKIVVINQHTENYGDDAAGVAMSEQIRNVFPNSEIHFLYNTPYILKKGIPFNGENIYHHLDIIFNKKNFVDVLAYVLSKKLWFVKPNNNSSIIRTVNIIKDADYILVSPCGANIGIYKDWYFLLRVLLAVLERKVPVFHLNTIGPSSNKIFDFIAKWTLKRSKLYVRETKSFNYLKSLGLNPELGVDTAFSLKENDLPSKDKFEKYVAFIPTQLSNWHKDFIGTNVDNDIMEITTLNLAEFCNKNNLKLKIIPHLTGGLGESKLLEKYKEEFIKVGLSSQNVEIVEDVSNFLEYESYIQRSEYTVSMRYHGVIFAIKNKVPFISLAYENKMNEACNYSDMSSYNIEVKKLKEENFSRLLHEIQNDKIKITRNLESKSELLRNLSSLPIQYIYMQEMKKRMERNIK